MTAQPETPRGRPRDSKRTDTILRTAYGLLVEHGLDGVTSSRIAELSGVSTATLYRRWPSKEALLVDAYLREVDRRIRSAAARRASASRAIDRLRKQLVSSARAFAGDEGRVITSLVQCAQQSHELRETFLDGLIRPRRAADIALVNSCREEGSIRRDVDPGLLLDALYGPLYLRLFVGLDPIRQSDIAKHFELVLSGAAPSA